MTSCTIIVSHYESLPFLRACVRQLRKFRHHDIRQKIIIVDQSSEETYKKILIEFDGKGDISIGNTLPLYSGYGIDCVLRNKEIETEFICQLHVDAFPIHKNWLLLPISLMQATTLKFVGQLHFYSRDTDTIYPPGPFFSMSPTFNVARTETYKEMSRNGGFTRFHEREKIQPGVDFQSTDWQEWAMQDYANRGSDDDVPAFHWEDKYRKHDKLGLALTGMIGVPGQEAGYGRIIDDLVFHFGFCRESVGVGAAMGEKYLEWTRRINEGFTDELIEEMVTAAYANNVDLSHPSGTQGRTQWDGNLKKVYPCSYELCLKIKELKLV